MTLRSRNHTGLAAVGKRVGGRIVASRSNVAPTKRGEL
jgi:hypothetical protein